MLLQQQNLKGGIKKMRKKLLSVILSIGMVLGCTVGTAQLAFAESTRSDIVAYVDCDKLTEGPSGWSVQGKGVTRTLTEEENGKYMLLSQNETGDSYYLAGFGGSANTLDTILAPAADGNNTYLVAKARMALMGGNSAEMMLSNNTGCRVAMVKISADGKLTLHRQVRNTASDSFSYTNAITKSNAYTPGNWIDAICVIAVDENNLATFTYYINGVKYSEKTAGTPITLADFNKNNAKHLAFNLNSSSEKATAAVDNVGLYMLSGGAAEFAVADNINTEAFEPADDIVLSFTNEIYKNGLHLQIDGAEADSSLIKISDDMKSVTLSAPDGGYTPGSAHSLTLNGTRDIFGQTITKTIAFTTTGTLPFTAGISTDAPSADLGSAVVKAEFSMPVNAEDLQKAFTLNGEAAANAEIVLAEDGKSAEITLSGLERWKEYTAKIDTSLTSVSGTELSGGTLSCSFTAIDKAAGDIYDYENYGDGNILGPSLNADVYNVITAEKAFSDYEPFIYETRLKFGESTTGHLRIRFQKDVSNSNNVIYFRNGKVSLRERDYGSGTDYSKLINVGEYSLNQWYTLSVYFDLKAEKPHMNFSFVSDDGQTCYKVNNVDIDPSMLALGGKEWSTMTSVGAYMQKGSSNKMTVTQPYQKLISALAVPFTVDSFNGGNTSITKKDSLKLTFSAAVEPTSAETITVTDGNGQSVSVTAAADGNDVTVSSDEFEYGKTYTVKVTDVVSDTGLAVSGTDTFEFSVDYRAVSFNGGNTKAVKDSVAIEMCDAPNEATLDNITVKNSDGEELQSEKTVSGNTITVTVSGMDFGTDYTIDISGIEAADGGKVSGETSFRFTTCYNEAKLDRTNDFSRYDSGSAPSNEDGKYYFTNRPGNMTVIEENGNKYLVAKADGTNSETKNYDTGIGVRADHTIKYYNAPVVYEAKLKITTGEAGSSTRFRINANDANHANILMFAQSDSIENGGRIGVLGYPGETGKNIAEDDNWVYSDDEWYTVRLTFSDYYENPQIDIRIVGDKGTDYSKTVYVNESSFFTGTGTSTAVASDNAKNANSVYIYSNGAQGKVRNTVALDSLLFKGISNYTVLAAEKPEAVIEDGIVTISSNVRNTYGTAKNVTIAAAMYNGDKLVGIASAVKEIPADTINAKQVFETSLSGSADNVKAMILENLSSLRPLAKSTAAQAADNE